LEKLRSTAKYGPIPSKFVISTEVEKSRIVNKPKTFEVKFLFRLNQDLESQFKAQTTDLSQSLLRKERGYIPSIINHLDFYLNRRCEEIMIYKAGL